MTKYNARRVEYKGITFDSQMECDYYKSLESRIENGMITECILQPKYNLIPSFKHKGKTIRATNYIADFEIHYLDGRVEIVDVKGMQTKDGILKAKLFMFQNEDKNLLWLTRAPKYWHEEWIEVDVLKKVRRERKKQKG